LLENVILALEQLDLEPSYEVASPSGEEWPIVVVRWESAKRPRPDPTLYRMIPIRQTSRLPYSRDRIPDEDLDALRSATGPPCALAILTDPREINEIGRLVSEATLEQLADRATAEELYSWLRFSRRDRRWWRDGLNADCMGWSHLEAMALRMLLAPSILRRFGRWGLFRMLASDVEKNAPPAAALALLTVQEEGVGHRIEAGRHLQQIWLTAASRGLSTHPISAAVDIERTRHQVLDRFGLGHSTLHVNLFRIGRSPTSFRSARLPADEILEDYPASRYSGQ
jgi:hypothetical protein